jgi:cobalt-zinc-cadmium efflux system membrane fusion protein
MTFKHVILIGVAFALNACGGSGEPAAPTAERAGDSQEPGADHSEDADHEEGHDGEGTRVALSDEQIKSAGIELAEAAPTSIRETLPLYGVIVPNAERVRDVGARFPGVIQSVSAAVGDTVKQGQTLAKVESDESLQTYTVTAPLSGTVTGRNANSGERTGDKVLFTVADLSSVWVEIALFPRDVSKVRIGQIVHVRSAASDASAEGKVVYVAPFGSSANQTVTARVQLDNREREWSPGLYVIAEADLAHRDVPLAVDSRALQTLDGQTVVFVRTSEGFEARRVRTGHADSERSEIVKGLDAGEKYAANNSFILKAELGKGTAEHEH